MLVQRFEPLGRRFTNFHYYYCVCDWVSDSGTAVLVSHILARVWEVVVVVVVGEGAPDSVTGCFSKGWGGGEKVGGGGGGTDTDYVCNGVSDSGTEC